jgi:hypothetical protein
LVAEQFEISRHRVQQLAKEYRDSGEILQLEAPGRTAYAEYLLGHVVIGDDANGRSIPDSVETLRSTCGCLDFQAVIPAFKKRRNQVPKVRVVVYVKDLNSI